MSRRKSLLAIYHESMLQGGHFSESTTINKICPLYCWPSMTVDTKTYVKSCLQCQLMKSYRPNVDGTLKPLDIPTGRWLDISIDFITGVPETLFTKMNMILVVIDRFTKHAHFIATNKDCGSQETLNFLYWFVFCYHGFPRSIVSDRDIRITTGVYKELTEPLGIQLKLSSTNHPQTDGQTDATNKTLGRSLRSYCSNDQRQWDRFLPHLEFVYNSTFQRSLEAAPFEVDIGFIPNEPLLDTGIALSSRSDSAVEITKTLKAVSLRTSDILREYQETMDLQTNVHRNEFNYEVDDLVLLHHDVYFTGGRYTKIQSIFLGPFKLVKLQNNTCKLDLPSSFKKHRTINIKWIKKFIHYKDRYPKGLPHISTERLLGIPEIISVVGYDIELGMVYCKMQDTDPPLICSYPLEDFAQIPRFRKTSLLNNFNSLARTLEEEGIVDIF
ncbi:hypothetical protein TBLA_0D01490 [Henningerozyma blattae CBS 6284]|uniref:Integrase catalytic domain-containing protein n=1 Tax=Henningerozyma blattae (strain ATCC 34711 / CBS 6284 / DSM 70876 / NBRC 10599 / NRRL Y-10934 / UCD 77-7) TaxID=1071380 RepID=I2H2Q5_HENB6|nr:hypothetical protein TBLA_0D01490 [Tetrapisispora blattae CBS 6284]CCH60657.1 hypothetical protein TBLA_0D01490 [Tetrapisispora blattae CBS 6284]